MLSAVPTFIADLQFPALPIRDYTPIVGLIQITALRQPLQRRWNLQSDRAQAKLPTPAALGANAGGAPMRHERDLGARN
jgi:hypothetical protein